MTTIANGGTNAHSSAARRAHAETSVSGGFWERFKAQPDEGRIERELEALLDGLGSSTLRKT